MFRLTVVCLFLLSFSLVGCGADKTQPTNVKSPNNMGVLKDKMKDKVDEPKEGEDP